MGSAPGTRETDLLEPSNLVDTVNAIVLTGGSAFGLAAATGVVSVLEESGSGLSVAHGQVVPIVPGAVIFDLGVGNPKVRPDADAGARATRSASDQPVEMGTLVRNQFVEVPPRIASVAWRFVTDRSSFYQTQS